MVLCKGSARPEGVGRCVVGLLFALVLSPSAAAQDGQCDRKIGEVVYATGGGSLLHGDAPQPIRSGAAVCLNSTVSVAGAGRVSIRLTDSEALKANKNRPIVTLGKNSSLRFKQPQQDQLWVLDLVEGWFRFFSPSPTDIDVETPYVTAGVRGTEFVLVSRDSECKEADAAGACSVLWVQEGEVTASRSKAQSLTGAADSRDIVAKDSTTQGTLVARPGQPLQVGGLTITPDDAVNWVLYYPQLVHLQMRQCGPSNATGDRVEDALQCGGASQFKATLSEIGRLAPTTEKAELLGLAAARLLNGGDVDQADQRLREALAVNKTASLLALQSVVALTQDDKEAARTAAESAVAMDATSADALLALSYVQQAEFDLPAAQASTANAAANAPGGVLISTRMAELDLSLGDSAAAEATALKSKDTAMKQSQWTESSLLACRGRSSAALPPRDPILSRAYTVLGFVRLIRLDTDSAELNLRNAICADELAPLPRLGLGLSLIRQGSLDAGVEQLETAVALDPRVSQYRSYLGKGYFEQNRSDLAKKEFALARELDTRDPTPWLYDAYRLRGENDPVAALRSLGTSIALNDNRAVYRSSLLVDADEAARASSLGRMYNDLGLNKAILPLASDSLAVDPQNASAHLLLADANKKLPRHEISRVSETLQGQVRQPLAHAAFDARLGNSRLVDYGALGGLDSSSNEYTQLFTKEGVTGAIGARMATNDTAEYQTSASMLEGPFSFSVAYFNLETDGYRENNDREQDYWNALFQYQLSVDTNVQFEYRAFEDERGDQLIRFHRNPGNFKERISEDVESWRLSLHHQLSPAWDFVALVREESADRSQIWASFPGIRDIDIDEDGRQVELQFAGKAHARSVVAGLGYFDGDRLNASTSVFPIPQFIYSQRSSPEHVNAYVYTSLAYGSDEAHTVTLGGSYDQVKDGISDDNQYRFNPKLGFKLSFGSKSAISTIRLAYFETLKRALLANQTLEPTTIAGFSQFYDDGEGARARVEAAAIDVASNSHDFFAGVSWVQRKINVPILDFVTLTVPRYDISELAFSAHAYWLPSSNVAVKWDYGHEKFARSTASAGPERLVDMTIDRVSMEVSYFPLSTDRSQGLVDRMSISIKPQWVKQNGIFLDPTDTPLPRAQSQGWVVDAAIRHQFPRRAGSLNLSVSNLFDNEFRFQDTDPFNTRITPERVISITGVFNVDL